MDIDGNPNPDFYMTISGFDCIADWAVSVGLDKIDENGDEDAALEIALGEGVCADDHNDDIYVPHSLLREIEEAA